MAIKMTTKNKKSQLDKKKFSYSKFKKLDGSHDIKKLNGDFYVGYQARLRKAGQVFYFNFSLAKQMGLIASAHPEELNKELEKELMETFGIIIINEYDIENDLKFPTKEIKSGEYMATRYLQLQHPDNVGKTSGDGRSIWNGQLTHKDITWDISSRGTGGTCLSPATSIHKKFFQSGDPSISYGCGYSEIDEGLGSVFFSEVFNKNKIKTERVLAVIDYGDGICINVRAYPNLLRPSHFFSHLKQSNIESLRELMDFYIDKEVREKRMSLKLMKKTEDKETKYDCFLDQFVYDFAEMTAKFEDEYIFCWLDWDGDNILMDGGIIDYGSIRQFGLFHHEYRYDDVDRYSTTIIEQKQKVKQIIQTFAQAIEYLKTGTKPSLEQVAKHWSLGLFEDRFEENKNQNFLFKLGLSEKFITKMLKEKEDFVTEFRKIFSYFERAKSVDGIHKVADGVNWNAIFSIRDLLRVLPQLYITRGEFIKPDEFIDIMASTYALEEDLLLNTYRRKKINDFQDMYWNMVHFLAGKSDCNKVFVEISMRSSIINRIDRITGDSISFITSEILKDLKEYKKTIYGIVKDFTLYQSMDHLTKPNIKIKYKNEKLLKNFFEIVVECREGI
ncbi:MAG: hypothetical protein ACI9QD_000271 [Thermoproteota archaeon]|jgi:uncharacterized protein YdiU (UPF0061 family)